MAKFDREQLLSVLADVAPALAKSATIPGLDHLWFDGKHVYAYDGGLGIRKELKTDLECGLPGKVLLDLIRTSALKEVEIEAAKAGVVLKMGKSKVNLVALDNERAPWAFPAPSKKTKSILELTDDVLAAFTRVAFVRRSGKPTTAVHNGISVVPQQKVTEFYATDSQSIARVTLKLVLDEEVPSFIAPWGFVDAFLALVEPGATVQVLDDCLLVIGQDVLIGSNLLEFPDHPDLPKTVNGANTGKEGADIPAGLQSVLDRAAILSGDKLASVQLSVGEKTLTISGKYKLGAVNEALTLSKAFPVAGGAFNSEYVRRGLGTAKAMVLTEKALVMQDDDFVYIVAKVYEPKQETKDEGKAKEPISRRKAPARSDDMDDEIPF
jgi:DNA polymerase III sliding clamp (beta) subunit (PCNA family)